MPIFATAIADDDTGATDLAGMLTEQGMRVILVLDSGSPELDRWAQGCDAIVIGTASRSIAKQEAYDRTFAAARTLERFGPAVLAVKYCSTFDSTAEGNIGASIDAAMDATGESFTVALPALPALGRTTFQGYHFVGQQLLSESVMRHHPLNPMTNSHLPSHLQSQTRRRVGLATYAEGRNAADLRRKLAELRESGVEIAVMDCVDDAHLEIIAEAISEMPLLSGSSAWAMVLPQIWQRNGRWSPAKADRALTRVQGGSGFLIVSGSCSEATRRQNAWAADQGLPVFSLDVEAMMRGEAVAAEIVAKASDALAAGETCLLSTQPAHMPEEICSPGIHSVDVGERIAASLAEAVVNIFAQNAPQGLIVAGGETSSVLMRALKLGGLRIGANIEPGVPVCVALAEPALGVVLKSGNFGSVEFYGRAIAALQQLPVKPSHTNEDKR